MKMMQMLPHVAIHKVCSTYYLMMVFTYTVSLSLYMPYIFNYGSVDAPI